MKSLDRANLRRLLHNIVSEAMYGPMQDPKHIFPGQTEELRSMNDELEVKKAGDYASFVSYLKQNIDDPKLKALLNSGHFDGSLEDDVVTVEETDLPVSQLQPTQSEIGLKDSIEFAAEKFPSKTAKLAAAEAGTVADVGGRIITADGKYIIDGHHRWSQVYMVNPLAKIPVYNLITPDSTIPGASTTNTGQDYLKMSQLVIGAVDGVIPQVDADTATDLYRTGGDPEKIRAHMVNIVPKGSKFATEMEAELFKKGETEGESISGVGIDDEMTPSIDMDAPAPPSDTQSDIQGELAPMGADEKPDDVGPTDAEGKLLSTASSGDNKPEDIDISDEKIELNELFSRKWVILSESAEDMIDSVADPTGGYDQVIDRLVNNAIALYNGTHEEAAKMTSRSEMPQFDKGGSDAKKKTDALQTGHIDWNAPYDQSDLDDSAEGATREDIAINEATIRRMIRRAIAKNLKS